MAYTFVNARLNDAIEQGAQGGPEFLTTVMALASGNEKRNGEWQYPRVTWDISYGIQSDTDLKLIRDFYMVCMGRLYGFRFRDWGDYIIGDETTQAPQQIGTGDGATTAFQIAKNYSVTSWDSLTTYTFTRKITRPVSGTFLVYVNGVLKTETTDYSIAYDTGLITFVTAPTTGYAVSVYGEFDIPVRFNSDVMKMQWQWSGAGSMPSINIIELRE